VEVVLAPRRPESIMCRLFFILALAAGISACVSASAQWQRLPSLRHRLLRARASHWRGRGRRLVRRWSGRRPGCRVL